MDQLFVLPLIIYHPRIIHADEDPTINEDRKIRTPTELEYSHHHQLPIENPGQANIIKVASNYTTRGIATPAPPSAAPSGPPLIPNHSNEIEAHLKDGRYASPEAIARIQSSDPTSPSLPSTLTWHHLFYSYFPVFYRFFSSTLSPNQFHDLSLKEKSLYQRHQLWGSFLLGFSSLGLILRRRNLLKPQSKPFGSMLVDSKSHIPFQYLNNQLSPSFSKFHPIPSTSLKWFNRLSGGPLHASIQPAAGIEVSPSLQSAMKSWQRQYQGSLVGAILLGSFALGNYCVHSF